MLVVILAVLHEKVVNRKKVNDLKKETKLNRVNFVLRFQKGIDMR